MIQLKPGFSMSELIQVVAKQGWRMVKSETRRDAEILVRNTSPRLFPIKSFESQKK